MKGNIQELIKKNPYIPVLLLLLLGTFIRAYYLLSPFSLSLVITPDESVYGLQALHFLRGDPSVFYWAQPYTGTPSAIISAFLFKLFSPSVLLLKVVPFGFSIAFLFTNYLLAKSIFKSEKIALITLFISSLGSPFWNNWSSRAGTGYPEVCLVGNVLVLLAISIFNKGFLSTKNTDVILKFTDLGKTWLIGFLVGFGFWIQPTIVYYAIPVLGFLLLWVLLNKGGFFRLAKEVGVLGFGMVIGALPVIYHNLINPTSTTTAALVKTPWGEKDAFLGLVSKAFPILLGTRTSWSETDFFLPLAFIIWLIFLISLGWFSLRFIRGVLKIIEDKKWETIVTAENLFFAVFLTTVVVFCLSGNFGQLVLEPRYVLALYSFIPLVIAVLISRRPFATYFVVAFLFLNFLVGLFYAPPFSFTNNYKLEKVITYLESNHLYFVKSDAELAHRIIFLSNENIIASVTEGGMMAQRRQEYEKVVNDASKQETAYVFRNSSPILPGVIKQITDTGYEKVFEDSEISVFSFTVR